MKKNILSIIQNKNMLAHTISYLSTYTYIYIYKYMYIYIHIHINIHTYIHIQIYTIIYIYIIHTNKFMFSKNIYNNTN